MSLVYKGNWDFSDLLEWYDDFGVVLGCPGSLMFLFLRQCDANFPGTMS
jgi:hypothetical protein